MFAVSCMGSEKEKAWPIVQCLAAAFLRLYWKKKEASAICRRKNSYWSDSRGPSEGSEEYGFV